MPIKSTQNNQYLLPSLALHHFLNIQTRMSDCPSALSSFAVLQESFGAFYRIEQLILSTTPKATSQYIAPSGLPSIVTDANIKLLFRMQAEVDAIKVPVVDSNATATLQDVCYKPFGEACATQSILQVCQTCS